MLKTDHSHTNKDLQHFIDLPLVFLSLVIWTPPSMRFVSSVMLKEHLSRSLCKSELIFLLTDIIAKCEVLERSRERRRSYWLTLDSLAVICGWEIVRSTRVQSKTSYLALPKQRKELSERYVGQALRCWYFWTYAYPFFHNSHFLN